MRTTQIMTESVRKYLLVLLMSSFAWAVLAAMCFGAFLVSSRRTASVPTFLWICIPAGVVFGSLVTVHAIAKERSSLRHLSPEDRRDAITTRVECQRVLVLDYMSSFDKAKEALEKLNASVITEDPKNGVLVGKTGRSPGGSAGEIVTVTFNQRGDAQTHVTVRSKPRHWTNLIDCGKNFRNVQTVLDILQSCTVAESLGTP